MGHFQAMLTPCTSSSAKMNFLLIATLLLASSSASPSPYKQPSRFPVFVEFTLQPSEFQARPDGSLLYDGVTIRDGDYELSNVTGSAHVFYPLSRDFLRCRSKLTLPVGRYNVSKARQITDTKTGNSWSLGDYYVGTSADVTVCQPCNNLTLEKDEYRHDGATFTLIPGNREFYSPHYVIDPVTLSANVCFPVRWRKSEECSWLSMEKEDQVLLPDKRIKDKLADVVFDVDSYVTTSDGDVYVCSQVYVPSELSAQVQKVCVILFIVSAAALAVAIIMHLVVADLSVQRAPLVCHALSLLVFYLCLAIRYFLVSQMEGAYCSALFYVSYISGLATFSWLTILAFDTFRISCCLREGGGGYDWADKFGSKKFLVYSLVGWGIPAVLAVFVVFLNRYVAMQDALQLYPRVEGACWLNNSHSVLVLFYVPMAISLLINFLMFFFVLCNLCHVKNNVEPFTNIRLCKQMLMIVFVVFMAMGIFWVMELISFLDGPSDRWFFTDIVNACQGLVVAIAYTCAPLVVGKKPKEKDMSKPKLDPYY